MSSKDDKKFTGRKITLKLSGEADERFTKLQEASGTTGNVETIREALRIYEYFLLEVVGNGKRIFVGQPSSSEEVILFNTPEKTDGHE